MTEQTSTPFTSLRVCQFGPKREEAEHYNFRSLFWASSLMTWLERGGAPHDQGISGIPKPKLGSKRNEDDEEAERQLLEKNNLWHHYRLFPPHGKFKARWDPFIQVLAMYNCTFIPMSLAFAYLSAPTHRLIDYCVDGIFLFDIFITMSTVFYNQHYELVIDRQQIIYHYLRT